MPITYEIAGRSFSTYWTIFLAGVVIMTIINCIRAGKYSMKIPKAILMTLLVVIYSFVGAKVLYYIENPRKLIETGVQMGGVSFFGSVYLVPILMYCTCKVTKDNILRMLDYLIPSLVTMLAVLRIGCLVSGCCGGTSCVVAGFYFEKFPTQITEFVIDLIILLGLLLYEHFWDNEGRLYFFFMVYYGIVRFMLEFLRDTPKDWLSMSHGQWFSIISVCVGGYVLARLGKKDKIKQKNKKRKKGKR